MKQRADKETIQDLRRAVELKVGFDITSTRDCEVLSMEIERFDLVNKVLENSKLRANLSPADNC